MLSLYQEKAPKPLTLDSSFTFWCHAGLSCFNQCCRQAVIIVSPYDILRLARRLGLSSGEFLKRYTYREVEEKSRLPLVLLRPPRDAENGCPFLTPQGCAVYEDRPAACRLFPITQGSRLTEQGMEDYYFCRVLPFCQGFAEAREWTVASWQAAQGFQEFDVPRRGWLEIILTWGRGGLPPADAAAQALFYLVAYDLDSFRKFVLESAFLKVNRVDADTATRLRTDDLALLTFGYSYLRAELWRTLDSTATSNDLSSHQEIKPL